MKKLELLIPPPLVMVLVGLFMWLISIIFPGLNFGWLKSTLLAITFAVIGVLVGVIGIVAFKFAATTSDPIHPEQTSTIVSSGIYAYTRNPMYLGVLLILIGLAVYLGNLLAFLGAVIFIIYINNFQIIPEEQALEAKFGSTYTNYKGKVRRWL